MSKNHEGSRTTGPPTGIFDIQIKIQKDEFIVSLARLALAAIYAHHTYKLCEDVLVYKAATSQRLLEGIFGLTKATILAGIGSVATGVFKTNIDQKEQLEVMVRERTKEIRAKNIELRRINIAFEACETAIAITDASRTVIWTNQAFESLSTRTKHLRRRSRVDLNEIDSDNGTSCVGQQLTDAIALDGHASETKLRGAFDFSSPRQDEIEIHTDSNGEHANKSQYRVEVTPFSDRDDPDDSVPSSDDDSGQEVAFDSTASSRTCSFQVNGHGLFLVAFHDITADRAREKAEQSAREEALLSKAMKDSMVTLTVCIVISHP
jgi:PAS domain-containing protein